MSDNKSQSNDHDMSSTGGHTMPEDDAVITELPDAIPAVRATLCFDLEKPEGERRLREMLDAPKVKLVLWGLDEWLRSLVRYGIEGTSVAGLAVDEALQEVRKRLWSLCDDHGIRLDEE